ncbi:MAG: tRNA pseudouridine(13) synthase TruD [Nanoarchaeota archaeon]
MFKLKNKPEDFQVKEILDLKIKNNGPYAYLLMKKEKWTTTKAIDELARKLSIGKSRISVAGMKDKYGITEQYVCIKNFDLKKLKDVSIKNIELTPLGYGNRRIGIGSLSSNKFIITVRNIDKKLTPVYYAANYYDDQRFGEIRPNTHLVGKELLRRNYERAMKVYLCKPFFTETIDHQEWRNKLEKNWGKFENLEVAKGMYYERKVINALAKNPKDYINAFRRLPLQLLTLFVQAYQSWLFNNILYGYIVENYKNTKKVDYVAGTFAFPKEIKEQDKELKLPMVGYTPFKADEEIRRIVKDVLEKEKVKQSDFKFNVFRELSSKTIMRSAFTRVKNLKIGRLENDELHKNKYKQQVEFKIRKGAYATVVIKVMYTLSDGLVV